MVKLTRIYTRTGDGGDTRLGDGSTVPKTSVRVEAYGTVDEANAALGLAVRAVGDADDDARSIRTLLVWIQNDLFDVGADLCVPRVGTEAEGSALRITPAQVTRLEQEIDRHNARLATLTSFILPGGSDASAAMHLARTITRRAERRVAALLEVEPDTTNPQALIYLNRLSDLLFVLGRVVNRDGADDVLWVPGAHRGG